MDGAMSETSLSIEDANALVGDDIAYWMGNPFLTDEMKVDKVLWWLGKASEARA